MVYLSWRLGKPPCTVHIFIPTILLLALFRKEERAFFAQKQEFRSFSAQSMLGTRVAQQYALSGQHLFLHRLSDAHEPRRRFAPNGRWGFSLNLSWSAPPTAAGTCRAPRRGICADAARAHKRVDICGFHPLVNHPLSLGGSDADYRHVTAAKRGTAEKFFYRRGAQCAPLSRHIRSARYRSATHTVYSAQSAA